MGEAAAPKGIIFWSSISSLTTNMGWGFFIPLYPLLLLDSGAGPFEVGLTFLLFNLISATLRFPFGYMADTRSRGQPLLWACIVSAAASMMAAMAEGWAWLAVSLALVGVGIALYYPAQYSLVAGAIPSGYIGRAYGGLRFLGGSGWVAAPFLAGILLGSNARPLVFLAALLFFATALIPAKRLENLRTSASGPRVGMLESLRSVWGAGAWLLVAELLSGVVMAFVQLSLPVYLNEVFRLDYALVGLVVALVGLGSLAALLPGGLLSDMLGARVIYILAGCAAFPLLLGWAFATDSTSMAILAVAYAFARGLTWISMDSLVGGRAPEAQRALTLGSAWAMWRLGFAFGSGIAGWAWSALGLRPLFFLASLFLLGSILFVSRAKAPDGQHEV